MIDMYVCMDAWMDGRADGCMHACVYACMYVCIYTHARWCACVRTCMPLSAEYRKGDY